MMAESVDLHLMNVNILIHHPVYEQPNTQSSLLALLEHLDRNVLTAASKPELRPWRLNLVNLSLTVCSCRRIRAGTELTWDYNYEVGSVVGKVLLCCCGSTECRGRLL